MALCSGPPPTPLVRKRPGHGSFSAGCSLRLRGYPAVTATTCVPFPGLHAVEAGELDCVVVYKVDRLSRSLLDFTRMLSVFEKHKVNFVAVTQQFNTSTSLGRLTLNILLSFAQFERELIGERTRDKMSAARRKGKWVGGCPVLGYDVDAGGGRLVVNEEEAERVRAIFALFESMARLCRHSPRSSGGAGNSKPGRRRRVSSARAGRLRWVRCGGC